MAVGAGAYVLAKFAVSCPINNLILFESFNQTWIKSITSSFIVPVIVPSLLFMLCLATKECSKLVKHQRCSL